MAPIDDVALLEGLELFAGLSPGELRSLSTSLHLSAVPAGAHIITADQPGEVVYVFLSGTVKIFVSRADGREVILAFLGPGDTVGEMSLVDSAGRSANAVTTEASRYVWMTREAFQLCLRDHPPMAINLVRLLSHRLRFANEQIQALATLDVPGRVARQILALAERYGNPAKGGEMQIPLRLTQSDLGDLVGASRERVNQAIVDFKQRGFLAVDGDHRLRVLSRRDLARYCQ